MSHTIQNGIKIKFPKLNVTALILHFYFVCVDGQLLHFFSCNLNKTECL